MIARASLAPAPGVLTQLATIARPWRLSLALVSALVILAAVVQLAPPLIVRSLVDDNLAVGRGGGLVLLALLYLAAATGAQGLIFGYTYLAASVAQGVLNALRVRLFRHLQDLPMAYYDQTQIGDAISRCTADVETVDTLFSSGVSALVANLVLVLSTGVAMIILSPPLALVSALVLPFLLASTRFFQVRTRNAERGNRIAVGRLNGELQESLSGIEVIRAFGRQPTFVQRFRRTLHAALLAQNRATLYSALYVPTTVILAALVTALLLWAGTRPSLADWGISVGTLTAYILLFQRFFKPIVDAGDQWQVVQAALSGAERIFQVLALPAEAAPPSARADSRVEAMVEVNDVVFGYLPEHPVLHGVRLWVAPGEQVALVGRTGAGKTSLLHLVAGLYAPWAGTVRALGIDPRSLAEDERRRLIGIVPQTVHLFSGSIFDNLTLRDLSVQQADVEEAAGVVGLHAFIQSLPDGYATQLGGAGRGLGTQLSAGQQQLLSLARALVWDPSLILLDEATSTIDNASDAAFRRALEVLVREQGRGVLTIAHRLATARDADRVIVLDHGRVVEEGSPNDLMRHGGRFADMLELEASGWDWRSAAVANNHITPG
jgi:ATP-binding cassette, subfamily B, multidrug efflux pump